ncbi:MAG: hypothetical protein CML73_06055 [Rhodobiaceae bacterium]|nr:hypothetical protein [Rhodobiaceae bacterium]
MVFLCQKFIIKSRKMNYQIITQKMNFININYLNYLHNYMRIFINYEYWYDIMSIKEKARTVFL